MTAEDPLLILIRGHLPELFLGPVFLFVGLCACGLAAIRRRGFGVLLWFGLFIGMAGTRIAAGAATALGLAPDSAWPSRVSIFIDHFLVVPGTLFWAELSVGKLRRFMNWLAALGVGAGLFSMAWYSVTGRPYRFIVLNSLIAIFMWELSTASAEQISKKPKHSVPQCRLKQYSDSRRTRCLHFG